MNARVSVEVWKMEGIRPLFVESPAVPYLHDSITQTSCQPDTRARCCSCCIARRCIPEFCFFFGMNHWQKFSTGFDQKPQNKDLEVLVSAAKFPLV